MKSFFTEDGECITFESPYDLSVFTSNDVVTDDVTGFYVEMNDGPRYKISEEVYNALKDM